MVGRPRLVGGPRLGVPWECLVVMFGDTTDTTQHTHNTHRLVDPGWLIAQVGWVTQVGWATPVGWGTQVGGIMVMFGCNVWLHNRHNTTHTTRTSGGKVTQVGGAIQVNWGTQVGVPWQCLVDQCLVTQHTQDTTHNTHRLVDPGWVVAQVGWVIQVGWATQVGWGTQVGGATVMFG